MDWKDVARLIAPLAPTLGGVLGGLIPFPGGALAGTALGNIIARQFGVEPTPQAVGDALARMSHEEKLAGLTAATERARIEVQGFVEAERQYFETVRVAIGETGATMREEIKPENRHWFFTGWRPASGWVFVVHAALFGCCLLYATVWDGALLTRIDAAWKIYTAFFGTLAAMVGVYVVARTADKVMGVDTKTATPAKPAKKP